MRSFQGQATQSATEQHRTHLAKALELGEHFICTYSAASMDCAGCQICQQAKEYTHSVPSTVHDDADLREGGYLCDQHCCDGAVAECVTCRWHRPGSCRESRRVQARSVWSRQLTQYKEE